METAIMEVIAATNDVKPTRNESAAVEPTKIDSTVEITSAEPTNGQPTNVEPATVEPTTIEPTRNDTTLEATEMNSTVEITKAEPTNGQPTTIKPTTVEPTTVEPATVQPTENDSTEAKISFRIVDEDGNDVTERERGLLLYNSGTVCDDNFNDNAAFAICREMGYVSAITWESGDYFNVQEDIEIKLDDVSCSEQSWSSCSYTESHNCGHSEDVFLTCLGNFYIYLISNFLKAYN